MTRHDVTELNAESFLEQPTVRPFHWRWGDPLGLLPMALLLAYLWPEFWRLATCRHPTSIDPPLSDCVSGKSTKPRPLACNVARAVDRRGPQARYWESR